VGIIVQWRAPLVDRRFTVQAVRRPSGCSSCTCRRTRWGGGESTAACEKPSSITCRGPRERQGTADLPAGREKGPLTYRSLRLGIAHHGTKGPGTSHQRNEEDRRYREIHRHSPYRKKARERRICVLLALRFVGCAFALPQNRGHFLQGAFCAHSPRHPRCNVPRQSHSHRESQSQSPSIGGSDPTAIRNQATQHCDYHDARLLLAGPSFLSSAAADASAEKARPGCAGGGASRPLGARLGSFREGSQRRIPRSGDNGGGGRGCGRRTRRSDGDGAAAPRESRPRRAGLPGLGAGTRRIGKRSLPAACFRRGGGMPAPALTYYCAGPAAASHSEGPSCSVPSPRSRRGCSSTFPEPSRDQQARAVAPARSRSGLRARPRRPLISFPRAPDRKAPLVPSCPREREAAPGARAAVRGRDSRPSPPWRPRAGAKGRSRGAPPRKRCPGCQPPRSAGAARRAVPPR
jgi:hypothetical protein